MKFIILTTLLCFAIVFSSKASFLQPINAAIDSSQVSTRLDSLMISLYERGQFTGSVLVARHGKVIYKKAFGMADRKQNIPFSVTTQAYIGSLSKPFTAMGIMMLKEKGQLGYDDPIRKYFPLLPFCMQKVTIKHLLQHTSGLATFDDFPDMTQKDVFNILLKQQNLHFTPGEKFEYNNAGYSLLGMIIEKISGQSLNDFLKATMFTPLAMHSTSVHEITNRNQQRAIGYDLYGNENNYDTFMGGNASIISTVEDLYRWDQALYHPTFIKKQTLAEAFTPSPLSREDPIYGRVSYGFGWWIGEHKGGKNLFHNGSFGGYAAYMERTLAEQTTIILLSNLRLGDLISPIREHIVNILDNKAYKLPKLSASLWLYKQAKQKGMDKAIISFKQLKHSLDSSLYDFSESHLNSFGYTLLRNQKEKEAIKVFTLNSEQHPLSANAFDSLAEAYLKVGNKQLSRKYYKRSLELDPSNNNARQMLEKLKE